MRGARVAFLGVAGLAVLAGVTCVLWLRAAGGGASGAGASRSDRARAGASQGLELHGVVLDGDVPVQGATVLVTSDEDGDAFSSARCPNEDDRSIFDCPCAAVPDLVGWRFAEGRGEAAPVADATTAEDGTFHVTGLAPGRYAVWAEAGELVAMGNDVEAGESVELVVGPGAWYAGVARDEEGAPIEDALVAAVHRGHSRFFPARTDGEGRFLLGPLPEGPYAILGWSEGRLPDVDTSPSGDMELRLPAAARVEGTVERDGKPVAGAEVRAQVSCSPLVTSTDAEGRFVLERLRPEGATLAAFAGEDGGFERVDLTTQDREGLVIALRRGATLAGEVRDDAGAPVPGVRISLDAYPVETAAVTDGDGRFRISGLPPDAYAVWLFPPPGFVKPGQRAVRVDEGQEVRASYRLLRAARLTGIVADEEGFPIAEAAIVARRSREGAPLPADRDVLADVETRSDRSGAFSLAHAAEGPLRLSVEADGFLPAAVEAKAPGELTVTLRRGGALDVEVMDENGDPVPGAILTATAAQPHDGEPVRREAATDASGWRRLDGLPAGRYRIVAELRAGSADGRRFFRSVAGEETVEGPVTTALTLRFEEGLAIAGKVVEEGTGRPLAGVELTATDEVRDSAAGPGDGPRPRAGGVAITDAEGRFVIPHLRPHRHLLSWTLERHVAPAGPRWTRPGETGLVLAMRPLGQVSGLVLGDDGTPLEDFTVGTRAFHAADGRFALPVAHAGRQTLRVQAEGFEPLSREVALDDRQDRDLGELRLSRGRTVRVSVVVAATAQPVRSAEVHVGVADPRRRWTVTPIFARGRTGRDGTVTLQGLPATALDAYVSGDGLAPAVVPLGASATELAVRLVEGGRIEGTVRNAAGDPVRNVRVDADSGALSRAVLTDGEGRFAIEGLAADAYTVELQEGLAEGNAGLSPRLVKLAGSGTVRVDFRETAGATLTLNVPPGDDCGVWLVPGALNASSAELAEAPRRSFVAALLRDRVLAFRGLASGAYTAACVSHPDGPADTQRVSLRRITIAGADVEATLGPPSIVVQEARAEK